MARIKRTSAALLLPLLWNVGADAASTNDPGVRPDANEDVIATLGGFPLHRAEYAEWLMEVHGPALLAEFLDQQVVSRAATKLGVALGPTELEDALQQEWSTIVKLRFDGDAAAYEQELRKLGHTQGSFHLARAASVRRDLLLARIAGSTRDAGEEALQIAFQDRFGEPSERIRLQVLFLERRRLLRDPQRMPAGANPTTFDELQEVTRSLAATLGDRARGGESFDVLVREYSDGLDADRGGWIDAYAKAHFDDDAHAAITSLRVGDVSAPVLTPAGYMVVRMAEREPVTLEQVRGELIQAIRTAPASATEVQRALQRCNEEIPVKSRPGKIGH